MQRGLNRNYFWKVTLIISILLTVILIVSCSSVPPDSLKEGSSIVLADNMLRSNTGGNVTIDVKYLGYKDNLLIFEIKMDTHSVDLDQYDLTQLTELRDDKGNKYSLVSWDSESGGHHRNGKVTFSQLGSQSEVGTLELIIQNVGGIQERTFRWETINN